MIRKTNAGGVHEHMVKSNNIQESNNAQEGREKKNMRGEKNGAFGKGEGARTAYD